MQGAGGACKDVIGINARVVDVRQDEDVEAVRAPSMEAPQVRGGTFDTFADANRASACAHELSVPVRIGALPAPLVVMLHGCTQSADDSAAGTRMNRRANEPGFRVVYPEQASSAAASKCWNGFKAQDLARAAGEPSQIAGTVRDGVAQHSVNTGCIFVAGRQAGAAMVPQWCRDGGDPGGAVSRPGRQRGRAFGLALAQCARHPVGHRCREGRAQRHRKPQGFVKSRRRAVEKNHAGRTDPRRPRRPRPHGAASKGQQHSARGRSRAHPRRVLDCAGGHGTGHAQA
jgi:hypothetical protein